MAEKLSNGKPYDLSAYAPIEIATEYPNLWATICKYFADQNDNRKAAIASLVINTCGHCHDAASRCQCWSDD